MEKVSFAGDMRRTRGVIRWTTIVMLVLGVAAGLMLFLGDKSWLPYVQILTVLAVIVFLLVLIFLLIYFLSRPETRGRRKAAGQLKRAERKLEGAQKNLADVLHKVEIVKAQFSRQRAEEETKFNALTTEINANLGKLYTAQEAELAGALSALQNSFIETNLKAIPVDPAAVPGIGDVFAEQLTDAGILSAFDVTDAAVRAIPGFGDSKALSLTHWRESLETALRAQQPKDLPEGDKQAITDKYTSQIRALQEKLGEAEKARAGALEALRVQEAEEVARVAVKETSARQEVEALEAQKRAIEAQAAQYADITFARFMAAALAGQGPHWRQQVLSWVTLIGFFLCGIANAAMLIRALLSARV